MTRTAAPGRTAQDASPGAAVRDEIRRLVQHDRIGEALDRLADEAHLRDPEIENEAAILRRRLKSVDDAFGTGTVTREHAEAERNAITEQLLALNERLNARPHARPLFRRLTPAEAHARARYLGIVLQDVENRLRVSIHNARFIDLGISDSVSSTHLPWIYRDPDFAREFQGFEEAWETYGRRLLLLGAPGSGKTTTLLHVAKKLLKEAQADEDVPVPLVVNLSKLRLDRSASFLAGWARREEAGEERRDDRVERWLIGELAEYPGISSETAQRWVEDGRVATLLDGLDEVDESYRAEVVRVLNASFLRDHPDSPVLVCSRIGEYEPLRSVKDTRVAVNGGITLQPLSDEKVLEYLRAADATGLLEALKRDAALHEIARTPLTLSMMTLAYGGAAPSDIPTNVSLTEQRHHLMETYVARMLQRKERRDRGIPFDLSADNDVPPEEYAYSPEQVFRYLGWLAVRLSVRMQTAVSLDRFFIFLRRSIERDQASVVWWATALACTPLVFTGTLLAGASVVPRTPDGWVTLAAIALAGAAACVLVGWLVRPAKGVPPRLRDFKELLSFSIATVYGAAVAGVASTALSAVLPGNVPPLAMGVSAVCFGIAVLILLSSVSGGDVQPVGWWIVTLSFTSYGLAVLAAREWAAAEYHWYVPALAIAMAQTLCVAVSTWLKESPWTAAISIMAVGAIVLLLAGAVALVGELNWYEPVALLSATAALVLMVHAQGVLSVSLLVLTGIAGGLAGGGAGMAAALACAAFIWLTGDVGSSNRIKVLARALRGHLESATDRCVRSPVLFPILACTRCLPQRFRHFAAYGKQALLLKQSGNDVEFVHRLLRDHFALRELRPSLRQPDAGRRVEAIRSLGFQGDAAIETLADLLAGDESTIIREEAVLSLGRIASPEVIPHLTRARQDPVPGVRRAAVHAVRKRSGEAGGDVIIAALQDPVPKVREAAIEVALGEISFMLMVSRIVEEYLREDDLPSIVRLLEQESTRTLISSAGKAFAFIRSNRAVELLCQLLQHRDGDVRAMAAGALRVQKKAQAIPALARALGDREKEVRVAAAAALSAIGTREAMEALAEARPRRRVWLGWWRRR